MPTITPKLLLNNRLTRRIPLDPQFRATRVFAASSLNHDLPFLRIVSAPFRVWKSGMTQHPDPDRSAQAGTGTTGDTEPTPGDASASAAEPAVERSRFSQWLASFGLGELQNPLLTRARPAAPRRPAG